MNENPYHPPTAAAETTRTIVDHGEVMAVAPVPRYLIPEGAEPVEIIRGEIDEAAAIALSSSCKPITVPSEMIPTVPVKSTPGSTLLAVVLVIAIVATFFWFDRQPALNLTPSSKRASGFIVKLMIVSAVVVGGGLLFAIYSPNASRQPTDPPLAGKCVIKLRNKGCSIEKETLDGRSIEVFSSWRCVQISESPNGWLLSLGLVNAFVVARSWMTPNQQFRFEQLAFQMACWQVQHPPINTLNDVPDDAAESFPNYRESGTVLSANASTEQRARRSIAKVLQPLLPKYRVKPYGGMTTTIWALGFVAALFATLVWLCLQNDAASSSAVFTLVFVPVLMIVVFLIWARKQASKIRVSDAIDDENIWYDYRFALLRMPLSSLPFRRRIDQTLVLGTQDGSTVVVLDESFFDSPRVFDYVVSRVLNSG